MAARGKTIVWLTGLVLLWAALFALWISLNTGTPTVKAVAGVAEAPVPDDTTVYMVSGQWLVYEGLYTPSTLPEGEGYYVDDIARVRRMSGCTYHVAVEVTEGSRYYFLLPRPHGSRLWVGGVPVVHEETGRITSEDFFDLRDYGSGHYDFVLQVPSASQYNGYQGILMGRYDALTRTQNRWLMLDLIAVGLSVMLMVQCMALFLFKRTELYLPLLALAALMELGHFMLVPRHPMLGFFTLGSLSFYVQFGFVKYFIAKQFVPGAAPRWMDRLVCTAVALTALCVLLLPSRALRIAQGACMVYSACEIAVLVVGLWRGAPEVKLPLMGNAVMLSGEVFYLLLNAGLVVQGVVDVVIMPMQYLRFTCLMAYALAACMRFARKFREADMLSAELEQRVEAQTAQIVESAQRLVETQRRNRQTLTGIVHNLRNPLFALGGYVDMLRDDEAVMADSQQRLLESVDRKIVEINTMVDDMLLLSRLEEGAVEFHFTRVDLASMLHQAAEDMSLKADSMGMQVAVDCPDELTLIGDGYHLRQVVDVLIDNALRHSGAQEPILVGARRGETHTEIYVADTGVGMDAQQAATIFERYASGRGRGSVGLGLAIAREVVSGHRGTIEVTSEPGRGATFRVCIPNDL